MLCWGFRINALTCLPQSLWLVSEKRLRSNGVHEARIIVKNRANIQFFIPGDARQGLWNFCGVLKKVFCEGAGQKIFLL